MIGNENSRALVCEWSKSFAKENQNIGHTVFVLALRGECLSQSVEIDQRLFVSCRVRDCPAEIVRRGIVNVVKERLQSRNVSPK